MSIKPLLCVFFSHSSVNIILSAVCSLLPTAARSSWENIVCGMSSVVMTKLSCDGSHPNIVPVQNI